MNILRELNLFKLKEKKFKKNIKNIKYYNYYKFDYFFIIYLILKADYFNYILINSIKNIDVYVIKSSRKEKSLSKTF